MKNLINLYNKTDQDGLLWYYEAHAFCKRLAEKHNLSLAVVCGIVAALSPGTDWPRNILEATALVKGKPINFTTYKSNVQKARSILSGEIQPHEAFSFKTGAKTYNFFHNLLCPNCDHHVTIDRHAYSIATGEKYIKVHPALYNKVANHYRKAATKLNILPSQLQAVLWVSHRKENNIRQQVPF